jgi:hypothetical protein
VTTIADSSAFKNSERIHRTIAAVKGVEGKRLTYRQPH